MHLHETEKRHVKKLKQIIPSSMLFDVRVSNNITIVHDIIAMW